jgi:creatinine amidohydrolase
MPLKTTNALKEMSWTTFVERKKETNLVIIPSGAFEVYGHHLPLGSDTLVAVKLAELVAERVNAIIGPTFEVGDSTALYDFPGTITIKPESFKAYMMDTVLSLQKWGFKDFLFINSHMGNVPMVNQISLYIQEDEQSRCSQIDFWRFLKQHDAGIIETGESAHGHASEAGTSVMLYLYPELTDTSKWVHEPIKIVDDFADIIKYPKFNTLTNSGTIGNATMGTREKGEALVQRSVDRIVQFLMDKWGYSTR